MQIRKKDEGIFAIFSDMPEKQPSGIVTTEENFYGGHQTWHNGVQAVYGAVWDCTPPELWEAQKRVPFVFPDYRIASEFAEKVLLIPSGRYKVKEVSHLLAWCGK